MKKRTLAACGIPIIAGALFVLGIDPARAADHLDTPTVAADPAADIADLFAWASSDGRRLNLVMTVVAHRFSDQLQYVFHIDSGERFGKTTKTTSIVCRFDAANAAECWAGDADHVRGDAAKPAGIESRNRRFRVFAGLRDDPYFNNVRGTRAALNVAAAALQGGAAVDAGGCASFSAATIEAIADRWGHTEGGPAKNFLAGWKSAALVISVDLDIINTGGKLLAVWASTNKVARAEGSRAAVSERPTLGAPIDRIGRPLTGNALIGPLAPEDVGNRRKEAYNRAARPDWQQFTADIQYTLGLYDGFDGKCGNQWLADRTVEPAARYRVLAQTLADDRLWIDSGSAVCTQYLAVELVAFAGSATPGSSSGDCGGRTPNYNVNGVFRSLLVRGTATGVDDGIDHDDKVHSTTQFPFLAAP